MKKSVIVIFAVSLCAVMLSGCGKNNQLKQSGDSSVSSDQDVSSTNSDQATNELTTSPTQTTIESTTISTRPTKEYLKTDPAKGEDYNAAIKAYNEFLSGNINAKDKTTDKTFDINEMDSFNKPGIISFALFDVNGDGISELHTRSDFYDVFSYRDGQLVRWHTSINLMDGEVFALDNRAIFSVHESTGTEYEYTTFGPDGTATSISFFDPASVYINNGQDVPENSDYYFNDKEVSKADYDKLTKDYLALSKKPASMEWHTYEP